MIWWLLGGLTVVALIAAAVALTGRLYRRESRSSTEAYPTLPPPALNDGDMGPAYDTHRTFQELADLGLMRVEGIALPRDPEVGELLAPSLQNVNLTAVAGGPDNDNAEPKKERA